MAQKTVTVTIENSAPENGAFFSSTWAAFHDGSFDIFNPGEAGEAFLEGLAEDANTADITTAFADSGAGVQQTIPGPTGDLNDFISGDTASAQFIVDDGSDRYFSYGSMILPSNDAFIANGDPVAFEIFDEDGNFVLEDDIIVSGARVWDAGTEVNDEIPENTAALGQAAPNTGEDENGTVELHPGFIGSVREGSDELGNILSSDDFSEADFTTENDGEDYQIARISFSVTDGIVGTGDGEPLNGTDEADTINGRGGDDTLNGLDEDDSLIGGFGDDLLVGGDGDDILEGRPGFDILLGGDGDDVLSGGIGRDRMNGGSGDDTLTGGASIDFFVFNTNEGFSTDDVGIDTITDFDTTRDFILLDKTTFAAITSDSSNRNNPGFSDATEFELVATDNDVDTSEAIIVHSEATGSLFYNPNGSADGLGNGAEFANVAVPLEADNFILR
ncbi:MAG: spondin domain-containing protein [Microcoleaceae cyanobacterium]